MNSRRDYRLTVPVIEYATASGTTPAGLVRGLEQISGGALAAIPLPGPWSTGTLTRLFDLASAVPRPLTIVANLATLALGAKVECQESERSSHASSQRSAVSCQLSAANR